MLGHSGCRLYHHRICVHRVSGEAQRGVASWKCKNLGTAVPLTAKRKAAIARQDEFLDRQLCGPTQVRSSFFLLGQSSFLLHQAEVGSLRRARLTPRFHKRDLREIGQSQHLNTVARPARFSNRNCASMYSLRSLRKIATGEIFVIGRRASVRVSMALR